MQILAILSLVFSLLSATVFGAHDTRDSIRFRQTNSHDIVHRNHEKIASPLKPRQSVSPCASAHFNVDGGCCATIPDGTDQQYEEEGCCPLGQVPVMFGDINFCCPPGGLPRRDTVSLRHINIDEPLPPMTSVPGHRTLLNAELAAKCLLGAGEFEHDGVFYQDGYGLKKSNWLNEVAGKTFSGAIQMSPSLMSVMVPKLFSDRQGEFSLSKEYKIRVSDLPYIANHIYELDPEYDAVYFRKLRFDRQALETIHEYFPAEHRQRFEELAMHLNGKSNSTSRH